jgi:RNA recognition motif-containing protein
MKLFVAGLPGDFDDVDLKEMFELYGDVKSSKLIVDKATGKSKGFGFVEMPDKLEAQATIEALDGAGLKGKKISVKEAEEQQPRTGGYGGNNTNNNNRFNNRRY